MCKRADIPEADGPFDHTSHVLPYILTETAETDLSVNHIRYSRQPHGKWTAYVLFAGNGCKKQIDPVHNNNHNHNPKHESHGLIENMGIPPTCNLLLTMVPMK